VLFAPDLPAVESSDLKSSDLKSPDVEPSDVEPSDVSRTACIGRPWCGAPDRRRSREP
jgi:hypothetical protein